LLATYGPLTTRELAEICDQSPEAMTVLLDRYVTDDQVSMHPVRGGEFWQLTKEHVNP
jgi:hypothetical protein